jgi:hypothetical protein
MRQAGPSEDFRVVPLQVDLDRNLPLTRIRRREMQQSTVLAMDKPSDGQKVHMGHRNQDSFDAASRPVEGVLSEPKEGVDAKRRR